METPQAQTDSQIDLEIEGDWTDISSACSDTAGKGGGDGEGGADSGASHPEEDKAAGKCAAETQERRAEGDGSSESSDENPTSEGEGKLLGDVADFSGSRSDAEDEDHDTGTGCAGILQTEDEEKNSDRRVTGDTANNAVAACYPVAQIENSAQPDMATSICGRPYDDLEDEQHPEAPATAEECRKDETSAAFENTENTGDDAFSVIELDVGIGLSGKAPDIFPDEGQSNAEFGKENPELPSLKTEEHALVPTPLTSSASSCAPELASLAFDPDTSWSITTPFQGSFPCLDLSDPAHRTLAWRVCRGVVAAVALWLLCKLALRLSKLHAALLAARQTIRAQERSLRSLRAEVLRGRAMRARAERELVAVRDNFVAVRDNYVALRDYLVASMFSRLRRVVY